MRAIILCAAMLAACGDGGGEPMEFGVVSVVSPAALECASMRTLWQVDCFCTPEYCEGKRYACFWDLSDDGLTRHPEMADLYGVFHAEMLRCRETSVRMDDIRPCEDGALARALGRCERRLSGLDPFGRE